MANSADGMQVRSPADEAPQPEREKRGSPQTVNALEAVLKAADAQVGAGEIIHPYRQLLVLIIVTLCSSSKLRGYVSKAEAAAKTLAVAACGSLSSACTATTAIWRDLLIIIHRDIIAAGSHAGAAAEEVALSLRMCERRIRKASGWDMSA